MTTTAKKTTTIEWTDHTWNPVTGCTNISPGCGNCYAEKITNRFKTHPWNQVTLHEDRLKVDQKWKPGQKIFLCSMGDLFHSAVPWDFIARVFDLMAENPHLTFQLLTKRPGRMVYFARMWAPFLSKPGWPANVWAGTSVENQKYAARLDLLAQVPAAVRFVSYEPALEYVDFSKWLLCQDCAHDCSCWGGDADKCIGHRCYGCNKVTFGPQPDIGIEWLIAGGESGPGARPASPDWFKGVMFQCQDVGVPFFFKQYGSFAPASHFPGHPVHSRIPFYNEDDPETTMNWYSGVVKVGKKAAGAVLDGRERKEFPEIAKVEGRE